MADWSDRIRRIADDWFFSDVPDTPLPETFILPLENPDLYDRDLWSAHLDIEWKSRCVTVGMYRDRPVGVMSPKLGAPAAAMAVDLLAGRGVTEILGIGFCGGIDPALCCGDLFVPEAAVSSDGTCPTWRPAPLVNAPAVVLRAPVLRRGVALDRPDPVRLDGDDDCDVLNTALAIAGEVDEGDISPPWIGGCPPPGVFESVGHCRRVGRLRGQLDTDLSGAGHHERGAPELPVGVTGSGGERRAVRPRWVLGDADMAAGGGEEFIDGGHHVLGFVFVVIPGTVCSGRRNDIRSRRADRGRVRSRSY
jgi:Phosphorylase superfamily